MFAHFIEALLIYFSWISSDIWHRSLRLCVNKLVLRPGWWNHFIWKVGITLAYYDIFQHFDLIISAKQEPFLDN